MKKEERKGCEKRKSSTKMWEKKSKKQPVFDEEEDWKCAKCNSGRFSSELIRSVRKRWVECDTCKAQYHYKCIPKTHLDLYGLDDDNEVLFFCHKCVDDKSDDDLGQFLESDEDN